MSLRGLHSSLLSPPVYRQFEISPTAVAVEEKVLAELFVLAGRHVSEWSRPLSNRKVEMVTDRLWPGG